MFSEFCADWVGVRFCLAFIGYLKHVGPVIQTKFKRSSTKVVLTNFDLVKPNVRMLFTVLTVSRRHIEQTTKAVV